MLWVLIRIALARNICCGYSQEKKYVVGLTDNLILRVVGLNSN